MNEDPAAGLKRDVGEAAARLVEDGMVVGLGTGSTANFLIDALGRRWAEGLRFTGIPTSIRSEERARKLGIALSDFGRHPEIDLTIDGADEIEEGTLNLVKGLGGALLREKIVAANSRRMVVIADDSKLVRHLGSKAPVPVEVTPFGWEATSHRLGAIGARVQPRRDPKGDFFVTDGGNLILDCVFGPMEDAPQRERAIRDIVGVVECGLFIGRAEIALLAGPNGVHTVGRGT
ncbi:ribose-5-phosphate isomerase RpiA [Acetobacteraceae bacterium KSS12]|uniref:Ribose-5-phosphate isomerase A n=1 Tax=Rhizosaccharibacter radicis TaxID=2782605 RepID=A0ABT1VVI9_9PROT|nr:ribose-5-phosphate isomerase RpiA [Acetobacteraceae bacterium KSS12]